MCRLFGMAASSPSSIRWALSRADNSLERQSTRHPDGWGLGYYDGGEAKLRKRADPAFADTAYKNVVSGVHDVDATHVVGHVRRATVGPRAVRNNHPFRCGPWIFAHNGTLSDIERKREVILERVAPDLREKIEGETDSELLFHLILTFLREDAGTLDADLDAAAEAVREGIRFVSSLDVDLDSDDESEMNVLLSNGSGFVTSRYGHGLYVLESGDESKEANPSTGLPHLSDGVAVASERFANRSGWAEVPRRSILVLEPRGRVERLDIEPRVVA